MLQVQTLPLNKLSMNLLTMVARLLLPTGHGSFIQLEGRNDCLHRTAMGQQSRHLHKEFNRFLDALDRSPASFTEGLPTAGAAIPFPFLAMHDDIPAACFPAGMTGRIQAELFLRVHLSTPLFGDKSVSENPLFFNSRYLAVLPPSAQTGNYRSGGCPLCSSVPPPEDR
jgi:hypothetical protein